eukprot:TRINITY_DN1806_c0_g1_i2.p1 TRINITY_DN1806_c0_g1~~TRINITY_DN1806_c0_g1_i2.p1  ORF type:complete len:144 (-),score=34.19 TRINITY_DN1806_c0_g1_i2:390-821(-)
MWKYILDLFNGKRMGTVPLPDSDLTGKVAIVTGASDGIGTETCRGLALLGAHVIMAVRNLKKGEEKAALINEELQKEGSKGSVELMRIDVSDQDSVRSFVEEFKKKKLPLHILAWFTELQKRSNLKSFRAKLPAISTIIVSPN